MWPSIHEFLPVQHHVLSCHILFYCIHIIMIKINVKKTACVEQFANGSAVFWVIAHFFDAAWKLNCLSVLTTDSTPLKQLSRRFFAVAATLKSIDYNVAMTFILNNNNNIIIIIFMRTKFEVASFNGCRNQYWVCVSTMTGTVCFERKNICNAEFGDLGPMGTGVKICHRKCHIWNRQPWFAYSLCHFYGPRMTIKGRLLLSAAIIKHFQSEKNFNSAFGLNCDSFGG